jgi:tetratricopeptide (TPR) repeat protein
MALRMQRRRTRPGPYQWSQSIRIFILLLASLLTSSGSAQGGAQSATQSGHEVALARALFEEGITLADQGDWAGAADRFERAHTLKPTSGTAFNWASALAATGKLTQAAELLEGVLRDPKAAPELKQESEKKLAEIAPRRAKLKLHVAHEVSATGHVHVDGREWPRAAWDVAMPVDPGHHEAVCQDDGRELSRAEITLQEGELQTLTLSPAAIAEAAPAAPVKPDSAPEAPRKPLYKNWMLWTGVGVALVAGAVAVAVVSTRGNDKTESPIRGNAEPGVIRW